MFSQIRSVYNNLVSTVSTKVNSSADNPGLKFNRLFALHCRVQTGPRAKPFKIRVIQFSTTVKLLGWGCRVGGGATPFHWVSFPSSPKSAKWPFTRDRLDTPGRSRMQVRDAGTDVGAWWRVWNCACALQWRGGQLFKERFLDRIWCKKLVENSWNFWRILYFGRLLRAEVFQRVEFG